MLSRQENDLVTRVGPGTPLGNVMRRYWVPVATSAQLPHPDCAPLRLPVLGENFVAFRDTNGKVGVFDELCMHRRASLALGRVEECGIRCLYHGWKFAVDGTVLETPNHADPKLKNAAEGAGLSGARGRRPDLGLFRPEREGAAVRRATASWTRPRRTAASSAST